MKTFQVVSFVLVSLLSSTAVWAGCEIVDGGSKSPYDSGAAKGLPVEKKAAACASAACPAAMEEVMKGAAEKCTDCKGKYVTCS